MRYRTPVPTLSLVTCCLLLVPSIATVEAAEAGILGGETKLLADDGANDDLFGSTVAIFGDTAVIGAPFDDGVAGPDAGSAYVFERDPADPSRWTQQAKLTADDGEAEDGFGFSVAIWGDTAIIGAPFDDDRGTRTGAAYMFKRDPGDPAAWIQTAKVTVPPGRFAGDEFGVAVAIDADTAVIGAHDDAAGDGLAYVFERDALDPEVWRFTTKLRSADGQYQDEFGGAVAISGDTIVVGAPNEFYRQERRGAAYVFQRSPLDPRRWILIAGLHARDGDLNDHFGRSVAVSGDTVMIGVEGDDHRAGNSGSVYVYERDPLDPTDWALVAEVRASDGEGGDSFGGSVALSGDTAIIGARYSGSDGRPIASGSAYLFVRDPFDVTDWRQAVKLTADDGDYTDYFGSFVAIAAGTVVVGSPNHDDVGHNSGAVYVYSFDGCATWDCRP